MFNQNCENVNDQEHKFQEVYVERCDKETENVLAVEQPSFLNTEISYLKEHKNEYLYIESDSFEAIKIDGLTLEMDDVFGTYSVMAGLKIQKKWEAAIKNFLNESLKGDGSKFSMLFNQQDGLWDLNFTLNYLQSFKEDATIAKTIQSITDFLEELNNQTK